MQPACGSGVAQCRVQPSCTVKEVERLELCPSLRGFFRGRVLQKSLQSRQASHWTVPPYTGKLAVGSITFCGKTLRLSKAVRQDMYDILECSKNYLDMLGKSRLGLEDRSGLHLLFRSLGWNSVVLNWFPCTGFARLESRMVAPECNV